jgi:hypothetical protein
VRTFVIAVLGTLALPIFYFLFIGGSIIWSLLVPFNPWASDDCSKIDLGSIISPDRTREAKVVNFDCGSAFTGYIRDFTAIAIVRQGQNPSGSAIALQIEQKGEQWMLFQWQSDIVWESANRLQVTLPEGVEIDNLKSRVDIVTVDVKRVQDRVAARPAN